MKGKLVTLVAGCALIWLGAHSAISQASTTAAAVAKNIGFPSTTVAGTRSATSSATDPLAHYIEAAFAVTHATVDGYEIHNWSQISNNFQNSRQISQTVDRLGQELEIQNSKTISHTMEGDGQSGETFYELYGTWADGTAVTVTESSFRMPNPSQDETILIIRADSSSQNLASFDSGIQKMRKALASINARPQISACIEGFRDARMSGGQENGLIADVFSTVHANKVEGVQTSDVTSISGYSTELPQYILTAGQKMNIQVGLHYDSAHQRTNVVIGAPIITVTY